jgi:hypothetical protein
MSEKSDKDITKAPESSKEDLPQLAVRAGLSMVPGVGGAAVEIFNTIVTPPLNKRRDEWVSSIATRLISLEGKVEGFSIKNLSENPVFITTVAHATLTAIRNHHEEKKVALSNAVINSAIGRSPNEDLQLMFINFVDFFTPWHLKVLSLLSSPKTFMEKGGIQQPSWSSAGLRSLILYVFPELKSQEAFLQQIIRDLYSRGLIHSESIGTLLSPGGIFEPQTTELGQQFVAFITSD